jgi:hypothetical protein
VNFDDQVAAALRRGVAEEPPPRQTPAAAFELANVLRRREHVRNGAVLLSAVIVAGGLAAGGVAWLRPGAPPMHAAATSPSVLVSSSSSPSGVRMDPDRMFAALRSLLPAGVAAQVTLSSPGSIAVVLTDGGASTSMMLNVGTLDPDVKSQSAASSSLFDCATRSMPAGTSCVAETDSTGRVVTLEGPPSASGPSGVVARTVDVLRADGIRVVVSETNSADGKSGPQTRSAPMLSLAQLRAIATSPAFDLAAASASPAGGTVGGAPR